MRDAAALGLLSFLAQNLRVIPATPLRFDEATVQVSLSSRGQSIEHSPGKLTMRNVSLKACIVWAYQLKDYQIVGPGWLSDARYDISGTTGDTASFAEIEPMLQTLLGEKLGLRVHRESRDVPVYALVLDGDAPRLHSAQGQADIEVQTLDSSLVFRHASMAQLADRLETMGPLMDRPVIDLTGLRGGFDFTLNLTGDGRQSIFRLVEQQLGLRLEPKNASITVLVVDSAAR